MSVLIFRTLGRVCLENNSQTSTNLKYDIPCDHLGFPYIPGYELLSRYFNIPSGVEIGFARLEDYDGLATAAIDIGNNKSLFPQLVLNLFTEIIENETGKNRVLRQGLTFVCRISSPLELRQEINKQLEGITHIGAIGTDVSGEIEIYAEWNEDNYTQPTGIKLNPNVRYKRLNYSLDLMSPLCAYLPYNNGAKSDSKISGYVVYQWLRDRLGDEWRKFVAEGMPKCSNAYICVDGKRCLSSPSCMFQRKNNKNIVEYRLANIGEQYNEICKKIIKYIPEPTANEIQYTDVEQKIIYPCTAEKEDLCGQKRRRTAMRDGQVFKGFFEGTDEQIRRIYSLISSNPIAFLGFYTDEGYGETVINVQNLEIDENKAEQAVRCFDVMLASDAVLFNDAGLNESSRNAFEQTVIGAFGSSYKLNVIDCYMNQGVTFPIDRNYCMSDSVLKIISAGSILRMESADGQPVDISKLNGSFIGYGNEKGYGELKVLPASDTVIRYAQSVRADEFYKSRRLSDRQLLRYAEFIRNVQDETMRHKVYMLALNDIKQNESVSDEDLDMLFQVMKRKYNRDIEIATMKRWYCEAKEANE